MKPANPFSFGALALDDSFTDREASSGTDGDILNGQDVVIFAPRRYGKSSLVWRATHHCRQAGARRPGRSDDRRPKRAGREAGQAIYEEIASPLDRAGRRRVAVFPRSQITPMITVDPLDGSLASASTRAAAHEIDATSRGFRAPAELGGAQGAARAWSSTSSRRYSSSTPTCRA